MTPATGSCRRSRARPRGRALQIPAAAGSGAAGSRPNPPLISDQIWPIGSAAVQIRTSSTVPLSVSLQDPR